MAERPLCQCYKSKKEHHLRCPNHAKPHSRFCGYHQNCDESLLGQQEESSTSPQLTLSPATPKNLRHTSPPATPQKPKTSRTRIGTELVSPERKPISHVVPLSPQKSKPTQKRLSSASSTSASNTTQAKTIHQPYETAEISINDVDYFRETDYRCENDARNKKREAIVELLWNNQIPISWYQQQPYWRILYDGLHEILDYLTKQPYDQIQFVHKGGRGAQYDFLVTYFLQGKQVDQIPLEFKYGCRSLHDYPQILSLYSNGLFQQYGYAEFFYDKYVEQLAQLYHVKKPSREVYLKNVYKTTADHEFFATLKSNEEKYKIEKKQLVDQSINEYLTYLVQYHLVDIEQLNRRLSEHQSDKVFLMFKDDHFYIESIDTNQLKVVEMDEIRNGNVLRGSTTTDMCVDCLLRWKNHAGIQGPAWQIKVVKCK